MRWLLIIPALIFVASAWSQNPSLSSDDVSQPQQKQSTEPNKITKGDQRSSEKSPLFVKVLPAPSAESRGDIETKNGNEKYSYDWIFVFVTTIATIFIAIFNGLLWNSTKKLWKSTEKSIDLARQEFISTHRPKLIVRRVSINIAKGDGLTDVLGVEYLVDNVGDTEAKLIEVSARLWFPESTENLPPIPPYGDSTYPGLKIQSGESIPLTHLESPELAMRFAQHTGFVEAGGTTDGSPDLIFIGYVDYEDVLKRKRRTAFLRRYNFTTNRFDPINHPDYEYQD